MNVQRCDVSPDGKHFWMFDTCSSCGAKRTLVLIVHPRLDPQGAAEVVDDAIQSLSDTLAEGFEDYDVAVVNFSDV